MQVNEGLRVLENVIIRLFSPDGTIKETRVANAVTTVAKNMIADQLLAAPALVKTTHLAIGTGTPGATLLGAEIDRNALTSKTRSGAVITMVGDWAAGDGTGALTEAGTFNVVTANTIDMHTSVSFAVVNKLAADVLQISWTLTIA